MIRAILILALSTSSSAPAPSDIPVSLGQARSGTPNGRNEVAPRSATDFGIATYRLPLSAGRFRPSGSASPSKPVERPGAWVAVDAGGATTETVRVTRHNAPQGRNAPQGASKRPGVVSEGTASWFCALGRSPCTKGYPSDGMYAAAGPALRVGNWRGSFVTFCTVTRYPVIPRCVRAQLIDVCLCPGRLVDLYASVWGKLDVPLSRGVVTVSVGWPKWWQRAFAGAMATEGT